MYAFFLFHLQHFAYKNEWWECSMFLEGCSIPDMGLSRHGYYSMLHVPKSCNVNVDICGPCFWTNTYQYIEVYTFGGIHTGHQAMLCSWCVNQICKILKDVLARVKSRPCPTTWVSTVHGCSRNIDSFQPEATGSTNWPCRWHKKAMFNADVVDSPG